MLRPHPVRRSVDGSSRSGARRSAPEALLCFLATLALPIWGTAEETAAPIDAPSAPAEASATNASVRPTGSPFRLLRDPRDRFTASELTKTYDRDLESFLHSGAARHRVDLDVLDRYAAAPFIASAPVDSSDIALVEERLRRGPTDLTPEEKAALDSPAPGVRVGIPSSVAATTAFLGGLALFAKILADFLK